MRILINTRLILFEGIPGSGKTTTSQLFHKCLINNGIDTDIYVEGCEHPIDLPFFAYLSTNEFHDLLYTYQQQTYWLKQKSIIEKEYVLTPYKVPEPDPWNDTLVEYLRSKEFCYSNKAIVSFEIFKEIFYRRFEQYVASVINNDTITIFESVLFQHQIHDINR